MEQVQELSQKIIQMKNNFANHVKQLMSNISEPVVREEATKKIGKLTNEMEHFLNGVERFTVMEHMETPDLSKQIEDTRAEISKINGEVQARQKQLSTIEAELKATNDSLSRKVEQQKEQDKDISNKRKLLVSRERMLQLSIEKNVYNRKIIYTYIAIICLVLVLLFSAYYYYK